MKLDHASTFGGIETGVNVDIKRSDRLTDEWTDIGGCGVAAENFAKKLTVELSLI